MKHKSNNEPFVIAILIPLAAGMLSALFSSGSPAAYQNLAKPPLAPPGFLFPVVWTILYILMGVSSYLIFTSGNPDSKKALTIYAVQLFFNFWWSILFFTLGLCTFSAVWIIVMIILIIIMIRCFYKINKTAAYLQIPYLIWCIFAAYLNITICLMNSSKLLI